MQRTITLMCILIVCVASSLGNAHTGPHTQDGNQTIYLPLLSASTRSIASTDDLQKQLDAAQPGDVITLQSSTYKQDVTICRSGTATAPITLRGAGVGKSIIAGKLRVQGAAYVVLEDFDINATGKDDAVRITAPAHNVTVRRVHLYGGTGYGVRVENDVHTVAIENSEIDHFDSGSSDAHGVGIMTASDVSVRGCNIHHNSGDAIQSNTPDYPGYNRFASNVTIEGNELHENRENAVDIKSTHGIAVRNNRMWGFRAVDSSDGMALQVQYDAQDVVITGNQIWDAVEGIEVTRGNKNGKDYPTAPQRVTMAGNLIHDLIKEGGDSASGSGIVVRTSVDVKVYNNTILHTAAAALYISYSAETDLPTGVDVRNNVLEGQAHDLYFARDPGGFANLTVDYNHYVNSLVNGAALAIWLAKGYERHPTTGAPKLDQAFQPLPGSPLIDSGVNVGLPFTGSSPDRGWGEFMPSNT